MTGLLPSTLDFRAGEIGDFVRRSREVVLLAAITGAVTGLFVRFFEYVVSEILLDNILEGPWWLGVFTPGIGLVISAIMLRTVGDGASSATSDEYLRAFHDPEYPLGRPRAFVGRVFASIGTLGFGGAMGLEGPSMYAGSAFGAMLQRRLPASFRGADHRTLLVAGAAAGVAAIFKAPATGAIFALEVPFRDQMARRMLLPALVASATGYLMFVALSNTDPIFAFSDEERIASFGFRDLIGAILIGVGCAAGARMFSRLIRFAKGFTLQRIGFRVAVGSASLAGIFLVCRFLTHESLTLGPGYQVVAWLGEEHSLWLLVAVFVLRLLATSATLAGGGAGGLFIPLVVGGAVVGRAVGDLVDPLDPTLYVLLGIAAFLGSGYRVPLAAVMFVAESTGQPGFIVPALFASVAADLVMGQRSVTSFQRTPEEEER
jgi:chloride channel protein, CIC family